MPSNTQFDEIGLNLKGESSRHFPPVYSLLPPDFLARPSFKPPLQPAFLGNPWLFAIGRSRGWHRPALPCHCIVLALVSTRIAQALKLV